LTARIDLDDVTRTTAGGLHLGAMGSLWQALVFGFGGVRALPDALLLDPHLPETFGALEVRLRYRGATVRLELRKDEISGHADRPVQFSLPDGQQVQTPAGHFEFRREGDAWSGRTR